MVSHHLAMFGGRWSSSNGDINYFICHVTSQNHVIERSSNFLSWSSLCHVTTLPNLVARGIVVVEVHFYFVTWSSKTIWLKDQVTITIGAPAKFDDHKQYSNGDIIVLFCHMIQQNHVTRRLRTLWVGAAWGKSPSYQVWWSKTLRIVWLYG